MNNRIIIILSFLLCACRYAPIEKEAPEVNNVQVGKKYRINLMENHEAGETWHLDENYDKSLVEFMGSVWHGKEKGLDFHFQTIHSGQTTLHFSLRHFRDTLKEKTYIVKIGD